MSDNTLELIAAIDVLSKKLENNELIALDVILALGGYSPISPRDIQEINPMVREAVERFRISFGRNLINQLSSNITPIFATLEKGIEKGDIGAKFFKNIKHDT